LQIPYAASTDYAVTNTTLTPSELAIVTSLSTLLFRLIEFLNEITPMKVRPVGSFTSYPLLLRYALLPPLGRDTFAQPMQLSPNLEKEPTTY